jgi:hypothetical protein
LQQKNKKGAKLCHLSEKAEEELKEAKEVAH